MNLISCAVFSFFSGGWFTDFSVRRVDGVIVYLNGVELWRGNMLPSTILWNSTAASSSNFQWAYNPCTNCRKNSSSLLKVV